MSSDSVGMKKYVSLSLTILCVIFIYCNSLLSADISSAQSDFLFKSIQKTLETIGLSPALVTKFMVRKLAHFCEYALLGFLAATTARHWYGRLKPRIFMVLFWGLFIPVTDEFLQLFVDGRVGSVQDIVLDFSGFIFGMMIRIGLVHYRSACPTQLLSIEA